MNQLDIMELIINNMPSQNENQERIKLYMIAHKSRCTEFINNKYAKETTYFNALFKSLVCDLSSEIFNILEK
mgnify:FL=1